MSLDRRIRRLATGQNFAADQIASERVLLRILPERVHFNGIDADGDA